MATQPQNQTNEAQALIPVVWRANSTILFSVVIVLWIVSQTNGVAFAIQPQLIDAPQRMPSLQTWSARYQEQADIYPDEEADRQRRLEAWSARYQKQ